MSAAALERAKQLLGAAVTASHAERGDETIVVVATQIHSVMRTLRDDEKLQMNFLVDLTCVDYLGREPRFSWILSCNMIRPSSTCSGRGGQPGM